VSEREDLRSLIVIVAAVVVVDNLLPLAPAASSLPPAVR
jgi:hypothetical protein